MSNTCRREGIREIGEGRRAPCVPPEGASLTALAAILREHVKWSRGIGKYDRVGCEPPVHGHRFNECLLRVAQILDGHERTTVELHRARAEISRLRARTANGPVRGQTNNNTRTKGA